MELVDLENELQSNDAVMIYFSGNDCGVCNVLKPKIEELFTEKFPKVKQIYISAEVFRDTAAQHSVLSIPTILVYFDNKEFLRVSRLISVSDVENKISRTYDLFFN